MGHDLTERRGVSMKKKFLLPETRTKSGGRRIKRATRDCFQINAKWWILKFYLSRKTWPAEQAREVAEEEKGWEREPAPPARFM